MSLRIVFTYPWALEIPGGGSLDCCQTANHLKAAGAEVILLPVASSGPNRFPRPSLSESQKRDWQRKDLIDRSVKVKQVNQNSLHYLLDGLSVKKALLSILAEQPVDAVLGWQQETAFLPQLLRSHGVIFGMIASNGHYEEWYNRANRVRRYLRDLTVVRKFRQADVVFARSNFMRKLIIDLFDLNERRVDVSYCGVAPAFSKAQRVEPDKISRFIYYGSFSREKGIFDALEALGRVAAQGERNWIFKIAGWGEEDRVREAALENGIEDLIEMPGHLDQAELIRELEWAHAAILPSYFESFGLAFAEAQSAGLPVIGYEVGGVPEIVEKDVTGWLVPKGQAFGISEAILEAIKKPQQTFQMGLAGRERVNNLFSWSRTAESMLQRIEELKKTKTPVEATHSELVHSTTAKKLMEKKRNSKTLTSSTRIELVEGYFDSHSQYWSEAYLKPQYVNDFVLINRNKIAVEFLCSELKPTASVLDAGCGAGLTTLALVEKGFFVQAMDISQKMLNLCEQNLADKGISQTKYVISRANVIEADLPEKSFDGIAALGFLQYQADEHQALMTLNKLIKPRGILVISGPVKVKISDYFGLAKIYYAIKKWLKKSEPNGETAVLHQISTHYYGVGRFRALLRDSGFQLLECKGHGFVNFAVIGDWTSRGQHFLHRFFTRLSHLLPIHRFGNDMVVVARKNGES